MRRLLTVLVVVALLVGGGVAVALIAQQDSAAAQEDTAENDGTQDDAATDDDTTGTENEVDSNDPRSDTSQDRATRPERGFMLDSVLSDLVADGVITQEQADQITAAMMERLEEIRSELGERRSGFGFFGRHGFDLRGRFGGFLDDGVLDADELAQLPENHPLNDPEGPAAPYLDDGQLTQEELDELKAQVFPEGRSPRSGDDDAGADDDANADEGLFSG